MMVGQTMLHYKILEKLGEGGMGMVYKARDTRLDRTVALKFLPQSLTPTEEDRQRFIREAKAAAALNHPNICTIHNIDEHEGRQFIVMEYIDGKTLRKKIDAGDLALEKALEHAVRIADALSEAHQNDIIHRDIKPENIMVDAKGRIKVMDFGLAKLKHTHDITKTGSTVGTLAYMSPEQIQGKQVDHRSDLFSLGIVLYEMLTGSKPFRGQHEAAMTYAIVNEEPEPASRYVAGINPDLVGIIEKLLQKNPEERYRSADLIINDLQELEKDYSQNVQGQDAVTDEPDAESPLDSEESRTTDSDSVTITIPGLKSRAGMAMVFVGVLVITGFSFLFFFDTGGSDEPELKPDRVLVMPFENRTGDASLDPLGRTASDWITEGISQARVGEAVSTSTVLPMMENMETVGGGLKDRARLLELARSTESGVLISGSFVEVGDNVQLQAQIIDAQKDEVIYTLDPVSVPRSEPMEGIGELQQNIMGALSIHVFPGWEVEHIGSPPAYEAYMEYWKGMEYYGFDYDKAFEHFERSAEIDPDFAKPRIFMAIGLSNVGRRAEADSLVRAIRDERDQLSSYDRYLVDWYAYLLEGKLEEALATLLNLQEIAPADAVVNYHIGRYALDLNRPGQTVDTYAQMDESVLEHWSDFVAYSWFFKHWAHAYHLLGEHEKELETAREAQNNLPDDLDHRANEAAALAALGRVEELREVIEESRAVEPADGSVGQVMQSAAEELRAHGQKENSVELAEDAVQWYTNHTPEDTAGFAGALMYAEIWDEAYTMMEKLTAAEPGNVRYLGQLGVLAALTGNEDEARQIDGELSEVEQDYLFGEHVYQRARIRALLGEQKEAMELIKKSFEQGKEFSISLHRDIAFEPLRDFEPFEELLKPGGL